MSETDGVAASDGATELTEPAELNGPTEPAGPAESIEPAESAEPAEPDEPAFDLSTIDADTFEKLVIDELDELPDDMVEGLDNVVFVTEDRPEDGSLDLLGLYDGVALTERGQYGFGELPDRIILYREPLLDIAEDLDDLKDQIHITLVHEIAHFYGIDDEQLHELGWG